MRSADSGRAAGVCATTKEKQSGSLSSVAPSQSATANWLLWEPHVQPHTHNWGPPSHMLEGAHTSRCSSAPAFSTQCSGDVWGPTSLLLYLIRDAVSCLVIVIVQICRSRLIAVRTATSLTASNLSLPECWMSASHGKRCQSEMWAACHFTQLTFSSHLSSWFD